MRIGGSGDETPAFAKASERQSPLSSATRVRTGGSGVGCGINEQWVAIEIMIYSRESGSVDDRLHLQSGSPALHAGTSNGAGLPRSTSIVIRAGRRLQSVPMNLTDPIFAPGEDRSAGVPISVTKYGVFATLKK